MEAEKIFNKYPKLFAQRHLPITQSCMGWGLSHGEGWYGIIEHLCEQIQTHLKSLEGQGWEVLDFGEEPKNPENKHIYQVEFSQIKSKFGSLRIYYDGGDETVSNLVETAEEKSTETCEQCGETASLERLGFWLETLCTPCKEEFLNRYRNGSSES